MDLLFLDANLLFSAAYRDDAGVQRLWKLSGVDLLSSAYAVDEASRNLSDRVSRERLRRLVRRLQLVEGVPDRPLPRGIRLPEKDRPILLGALAGGATHLVTGDVTHFGPYFGSEVESLRILTPARYLDERT
ncbi:MAG: DNA-binding protein [Gemmatimonadota bacterium]